jgi:glutaconate CoA-transferase subunit B
VIIESCLEGGGVDGGWSLVVTKVSEEIRRTANRMAVLLARQIKDGDRVFHGVASTLPMTAIMLARRLHAPKLVYLNIPGGVGTRPSKIPLSTTGFQLIEKAQAIFSLTEVFDLSSRGGLDLAFLSGAQIDAHGDVNLSFIGDPANSKVRLPGGAGSAAILPTAKRTILWRTVHDQRSFPESSEYTTASGLVDRVVTPLCIFKKGEDGHLYLESRHMGVTSEMVQNATGFHVNVLSKIPETAEPSPEELLALESVDPDGVHFSEFV